MPLLQQPRRCTLPVQYWNLPSPQFKETALYMYTCVNGNTYVYANVCTHIYNTNKDEYYNIHLMHMTYQICIHSSREEAPSAETLKSNRLSFLGGGKKCPICLKTVYKMEEVVAGGYSWHAGCFACGAKPKAGEGIMYMGVYISNIIM